MLEKSHMVHENFVLPPKYTFIPNKIFTYNFGGTSAIQAHILRAIEGSVTAAKNFGW